MNASIIISVYKNTQALYFVLESLRRQTISDFEIIISEDGNDIEMCKFVEAYDWFCEYQHLTQSDLGWRKNRALNRAILAAKNDWLIFIDGDCLVHRRFVEMHLRYAMPNRILLGRRVKLLKVISEKIISGKIKLSQIGINMIKYLFVSGAKQVEDGIFIPFLLNKEVHKAKRLIGCNMSFSKKAIVSINGFDEDYIKPCVGEDSDINWRFKAAGFDFYSVRNRAVLYHLYHKENWVEFSENKAMMKEKQKVGKTKCERGLNLHIM